MSKADNGGPAFPAPELGKEDFGQPSAYPGMFLRDYFAAKAMQADMIVSFSDATPDAGQAFIEAADAAGRSMEDHLAFNSYLIADAMLKARAS